MNPHWIPGTHDHPFVAESIPFRRMCLCLLREGIATFEAASRWRRWQLLEIPNFGRKSLSLLADVFSDIGLPHQDLMSGEDRERCAACGRAVRRKAI